VNAVTRVPERIEEAAKGRLILDESVESAKVLTAEEITKTVGLHEMDRIGTFGQVEDALTGALTMAGRQKMNDLSMKMYRNNAAEAMGAMEPSQLGNIGDVIEQVMYSDITRKMMPFESKVGTFWEKVGEKFIPHMGHPTIAP